MQKNGNERGGELVAGKETGLEAMMNTDKGVCVVKS